MGTPIKNLLRSKVLSPLSPFAKQNLVYRHGGSPFQKQFTPCKNLAKTLNFQISPHSLVTNAAAQTHTASKPENRDKVQINVTDCSTQSLLVNTPNKNILMKNGLSSTKNLNILGRGSFGTVVRGIYKGIDVAVKIVKLSKNSLSSLKETNVLHFNHENVIKIIDIIHSRNTSYGIILMEYLQCSRHLQSILDDPGVNLSQPIVVAFALDVCKGLQYCHENEVMHLDLKPSNILVCEGGSCKLCDFGNSVKLDEVNKWNSHQCTVAYAAPEVLRGKTPTFKCDVYSLGVTLWQMRYRVIPYSELDGVEVIIYRVVKFSYRPDVSSTSVKDEYYSIYSSCWAANPSDRPDISLVLDEFKKMLLLI